MGAPPDTQHVYHGALMNDKGNSLKSSPMLIALGGAQTMFRNITKEERRKAKKTTIVDSIYETVVQTQKDTTITVTFDKTNNLINVDNPTQIKIKLVFKS